ncbi:MAG: glycosyltransferase family 2 protein [Oscillospiraceae bacterium]
MASFISNFNIVMLVIFSVLYFHQIIYIAVAIYNKMRKEIEIIPNKFHKYAVLVAARNEELVIGELIKSIQNQNYQKELVDIYIIADNCTDSTAEVAKNLGAFVVERNDISKIGKGYALKKGFSAIDEKHGFEYYDGYFVFDADNLLDENYICEMNKQFDNGYKILTSYRNTKNYDTNWISAGYSLYFLREAEYLNNPRMQLKTSCAISGTGFLIHNSIIKENGGWKHFLLTEDMEFSIDNIIKGEVIGYCGSAKIYDEQPCTFCQAWKQRLRWSKGFYQVFTKHSLGLFKSIFTKKNNKFASFDFLMIISPSMLVSLFTILFNIFFIIYSYLNPLTIDPKVSIVATSAVFGQVFNLYFFLYLQGALTTLSEWKQIYCSAPKKILYTFTFPIFFLSNIPISVVALFKKVQWEPIKHDMSRNLEDVRQKKTTQK